MGDHLARIVARAGDIGMFAAQRCCNWWCLRRAHVGVGPA
jgi:hypothetical protein